MLIVSFSCQNQAQGGRNRVFGGSKKSELLKSNVCRGFPSFPSPDFFFFCLKSALVFKFRGRFEVVQGDL